MEGRITTKSFTLHGHGDMRGMMLTAAETEDRYGIYVRIGQDTDFHGILLDAEQWDALCTMNSSYDGLEIRTRPEPASAEEAEEAEADIQDKMGFKEPL